MLEPRLPRANVKQRQFRAAPLHELIEDKSGAGIKLRTVSAPAPVIDLMSALKRSLAQEQTAKGGKAQKAGEADQDNA